MIESDGRKVGGGDQGSRDGEHAPKTVAAAQEEERSDGGRNGGDRERRKEEKAIAEGVHASRRLPFWPVRRRHMERDDFEGDENGGDETGGDEAELCRSSHPEGLDGRGCRRWSRFSPIREVYMALQGEQSDVPGRCDP